MLVVVDGVGGREQVVQATWGQSSLMNFSMGHSFLAVTSLENCSAQLSRESIAWSRTSRPVRALAVTDP